MITVSKEFESLCLQFLDAMICYGFSDKAAALWPNVRDGFEDIFSACEGEDVIPKDAVALFDWVRLAVNRESNHAYIKHSHYQELSDADLWCMTVIGDHFDKPEWDDYLGNNG